MEKVIKINLFNIYMKFIHSEVPELSEEILPRSTQEENEIPLHISEFKPI